MPDTLADRLIDKDSDICSLIETLSEQEEELTEILNVFVEAALLNGTNQEKESRIKIMQISKIMQEGVDIGKKMCTRAVSDIVHHGCLAYNISRCENHEDPEREAYLFWEEQGMLQEYPEDTWENAFAIASNFFNAAYTLESYARRASDLKKEFDQLTHPSAGRRHAHKNA